MTSIVNGESGLSVRNKLNFTLAEFSDVVRDFGADPTGGADCKPAFQSAVNAGGRLYVPPGLYLFNSGVDLSTAPPGTLGNRSTVLMGASAGSVTLSANFNGFIFDQPLGTGGNPLNDVIIEGLTFHNINTSSGAGGVQIKYADGLQIRNSFFQCHKGVIIAPTHSNDLVSAASVTNCRFLGLGGVHSPTPGSIGIALGPESAMGNCSVVNVDTGIMAWGAGGYIDGCRIEVNNNGVRFGIAADGFGQSATAWSFRGTSMEGNVNGISLESFTDLTLDSIVITDGTNGPNSPGHSTDGIKYFGGNGLLCISVNVSGPFAGAGFHSVSGAGNQGQPEATFINCNISGMSNPFLSSGGSYEGWEAYNCGGLGDFTTSIGNLLRLSYLQPGARRIVFDLNALYVGGGGTLTSAFGLPVTKTGGTAVATSGPNNANGGAIQASVWKANDNNWYVG